MKLITLAFVLCLAAVAQDNPEFTGWMKSTKAAMDALSKNEKKTGPEATASAEKLFLRRPEIAVQRCMRCLFMDCAVDDTKKRGRASLCFEWKYPQKVQFESKLNFQPIVNSAPFNSASCAVASSQQY